MRNLLALMFLFLPLTVWAGQVPQNASTFDFLQVVYAVPDAEFHKDFAKWYKTGQVRLKMSNTVATLAVQGPVTDAGERAVTILIGPNFFEDNATSEADQTFDSGAREQEVERYSQIYRVYVQLLNHFSGLMTLMPPDNLITHEQRAQYQWNQELVANLGQFEFLKSRGYGYVMIKSDRIDKLGEWKALAEYTYKNLKSSTTHGNGSEDWDQLYQQALNSTGILP